MSLAFSVVIILGFVAIALVAAVTAQARVRQDFLAEQFQAPGGLVDELAGYYQAHGSWNGADTLLAGASAVLSHWPVNLTLIDPQGQVVYDARGVSGTQPGPAETTRKLPIQVGGQTAGYLEVERLNPGTGPAQEQFLLGQVSRDLLTVAVISSVIGILFGVLMSRSLTAPLRRLAQAARAIGARNLSQRVEVSGSDEVKELARDFNEMAAALEQGETLRRNLVADVAHELRTPLSVLQGNLRAVLDDVYPLEKAEVARLYDQTRLLSRLVNDLRELAQAEAGRMPLNLQPADMAQLVNAAVTMFNPIAEANGVTLNAQLPADLPPVRADSARMAQVLHNLLTNALRYTPPGGTISLSTGRENGVAGRPCRLWLAVRDTGEGILPEHLPHIFERFYRVDPARRRAAGGTGLGLAIVRAIVEAHGGQISATSDGVPGHGSTFTVHLPLDGPCNDHGGEV
jgi:two-component system OmpR family sensor kinase/two-component system sensor histidine kinase BaeS